ncbi:MAG: DUF4870 domain-containing protein [Acidobacteriota bacterium]
MSTEPHVAPPNCVPREARKWAVICHVASLAGLLGNGLGFVLGPLIAWLIKKDDHPYIDQQGKESLNFQLTMLLALMASGVLCLVVIGFFLLPVVILLMIIFPIVGAVRASRGENFRYPLTLRMIR